MTEYIDGRRWPAKPPAVSPFCSCGKPFPEDGGKEGVCECCSTCVPAGSETPNAAPDQQTRPGVPDALRDFLRLPEVYVHPDEQRCAVVISMPAYLARGLAELHPNPLQVRLAAQLIEAAEMDAADVADERRTGWVFQ